MDATSEIHYPTHPESGYVIVEHLDEEQLSIQVAYDALSVVVPAYRTQFEGPTTATNLPLGTIESYFQPEDEVGVRRHLDRMADHIEHQGSQYWFAVLADDEPMRRGVEGLSPAGLIKASPSRATLAQRLKVRPPNMYLNDIVVKPEVQHRGIGADLLHVVTKFGGYSEKAAILLDGYEGNLVNEWFISLGIHERPEVAVEAMDLGNRHSLEQVRFETGAAALRGVVRSLEEKYPHLKQAKKVSRHLSGC